MKCFVFVIFMLLTLARKLSSLRLAHHHLHHDNSSPRALKSSFISLNKSKKKYHYQFTMWYTREEKERNEEEEREWHLMMKGLFHRPATWNVAYDFFANSSMKLEKIPHQPTETAASVCTRFASYPVMEKLL